MEKRSDRGACKHVLAATVTALWACGDPNDGADVGPTADVDTSMARMVMSDCMSADECTTELCVSADEATGSAASGAGQARTAPPGSGAPSSMAGTLALRLQGLRA